MFFATGISYLFGRACKAVIYTHSVCTLGMSSSLDARPLLQSLAISPFRIWDVRNRIHRGKDPHGPLCKYTIRADASSFVGNCEWSTFGWAKPSKCPSNSAVHTLAEFWKNDIMLYVTTWGAWQGVGKLGGVASGPNPRNCRRYV